MDTHAAPILLPGIDMWCRERRQGVYLKCGGAEPVCHSRKLWGCASALNHSLLIHCVHTVDIGPRGERGVMRQRLGHIVVCAAHIFVFLWEMFSADV